jgi:Zn finger protein HypA/HybF involved in hydrogenase expression
LREEIAETYQKMLDAIQPITYGQAVLDAPSDTSPASKPKEKPKRKPKLKTEVAGDDDFQLAPGLDLMSQEQHTLQQVMAKKVAKDAKKAEAAKTTNEAAKTPEDSETYGIKSPPATDASAAETTAPSEPETPAKAAATAEAKESTKAKDSNKDSKETTEAPSARGKSTSPMDVGADALLEIAKQEENETATRRKTRAKEKAGKGKVAMPGYVYVYCPNGHQIQVDESKRGMTGRCPRCKSFFHVPALDWKKEKEDEIKSQQEAVKESRFTDWLVNAHLHQLDPTKLKLKPGSLEKDFYSVDLGFAPDEWLLVGHGKQGAGFAKAEKNPKKIEGLRGELQEYLRLGKEILDLPASAYRQFNQEELKKLLIVQPAAYAHESMFAGVPVFGEGRIAVRLPITDQDAEISDILFMSFSLSEFRKLATTLKEYGVEDFGSTDGVPLLDEEATAKCHYSDREIKSVNATTYHNADPEIELVVVGRKCQACSLVVSEDSRKKEKLGGATGKSIAKTACPKCKQKFGGQTLFGIKTEDGEPDKSLGETGGLNS